MRNAIGSFSTEEEQLDAAAVSTITGDTPLGDGETRNAATELREGLRWHAGLEVEKPVAQKVPQNGVATSARDNSSARSLPLMNSASRSPKIFPWSSRRKPETLLPASFAT